MEMENTIKWAWVHDDVKCFPEIDDKNRKKKYINW